MRKISLIPVTLALLAVSFFGQGNGDFWGIKTAFGYGSGAGSIATVSSTVYTVDDNDATISNVPVGTTKVTFLANLTEDEATQTWNSDQIANPVVTGNKLVVTAENSDTWTYTITVNPPAPTITSVATDSRINNAEKAAIHVIGTAQANSLVSVSLSDGTNIKTGTQQLSGGATAYDITIDGTTATALADGNITVSVTATNSLGGTSLAATTTATKDIVAPTVTKLGNNTADVTIATSGTATITFNETLSAGGKAAVEGALSANADRVITYGWVGGVLTITGNAGGVTTFATDVVATATDLAGNAADLLIVDSVVSSTKLGDDSADVTIAAGATPTITFSQPLSVASKTAVQNALLNGADKVITFAWNGANTVLTITGHATDVTTFANDVVASVSGTTGNANSVLLVDSSIAANQIQPNGTTGNVAVDNTTPEVVVTDPALEVNATIAAGTTAPEIDVSSFINNGTGTLPAINIVSNNASNVNVEIPASTTVTSADATWNGVIAAPTNTTVAIPSADETLSATSAIQIGFTGAKLSFDKAVRILVPGQAGKRAGYVRTGITFTEITTTCTNDTQATNDLLPADGDCKISVGSDLVIWTKHFTTFASFVAVTGSGGSTGGGGGGTASNPFTTTSGLSIIINGGDQRTLARTVTLTLNGGSNAKKMAITNGDSFVGSFQEDYASTKEWTLSEGEAMKNVCVKFYDVNGYYSNVICDSIAYGANVVIPASQQISTSRHIAAIDNLLYFTYGQIDPKIQQLQLELKKAGFMDQSVVLSNRYGEKTREAVQKYQQSLSSTSTTLSKPLSEMTREELIRLLLILIIQKYGIH